MVRTFALAPQTVRRSLRKTFWRLQAITLLSFLAFGLFLATRPVHWPSTIPVVAVVALAYFAVNLYNYRRQTRSLLSVRLEIAGSSLTYRQLGHEPVHVSRADIFGVDELPNGLLLETVDPRVKMFIPNGLARGGDQDVREVLSAWTGVEMAPRRESRLRGWLYLAGFLGGLLILLFANTLIIIVPLGLFLFFYGYYAERRLGLVFGAPPSTVKMYSAAFSFLLFVIFMKSCLLGMALMMSP